MQVVMDLIWIGSYGNITIDDICEKANVKRGSFYYFFDSKADLAVAALDDEWGRRRPELDAIFSPVVPPLERLKKYCDYGYKVQEDMRNQCGHVPGCALFALGCEVSAHEPGLAKKVQEILDRKRKYLESAIRDAHAAGLIHAPDAVAKARTLFTYYEGQLTEARIQNDLEVLRGALQGTYELLGVHEAAGTKD
jgi:TetR/AcrR family transcriptional regulator, transcriptional repressor for nem operon